MPDSPPPPDPIHGSRTIDLHTHTTASDGTLAPAELVRLAAEAGLVAIGITDHDTVGALAEAMEEGAQLGVQVIPGVELGTQVPGVEFHILGYFVAWNEPAFVTRLAELASQRVTRVTAMVARLNQLGCDITLERVLEISGLGSVGRPHVARALVERGFAADVSDAFERYLKIGRPAYIPRHPFSPEDAVNLIRSFGGVAVIAHPYSTKDPEGAIARLLPCGLAGIEVYYGEYDNMQRQHLRELADHHGLIATGGSDFHGPGMRANRELGSIPLGPEVIEQLRHAASRSTPAEP